MVSIGCFRSRESRLTRSGVSYLRGGNDDAGSLGHVRNGSSSQEESSVDVGLVGKRISAERQDRQSNLTFMVRSNCSVVMSETCRQYKSTPSLWDEGVPVMLGVSYMTEALLTKISILPHR